MIIDMYKVWNKICYNRKKYYFAIFFSIILSSSYIICIPRTYVSETSLAPETGTSDLNSGVFGNIASSLGFNLPSMPSVDAITPLLYPELMEDNGFVAGLFSIKVRSCDGLIDTTYYAYKKFFQKHPWWNSLFSYENDNDINKNFFSNPYELSVDDEQIVDIVKNSIKIAVDIKTNIITISVQEQDPVICKTMADSVREHLQIFITNYRTNKARNDVEYYKKLTIEAKSNYEKARSLFSNYSDANTDVVLQSYRAKLDELENDMQLKYNTYSAFNSQYQASVAKVQERTPVFTVIRGASVPTKPFAPRRVLFVCIVSFCAVLCLTVWIFRKDFVKVFM